MTLQNTAHPSCGVVQDKTQILTQVYPNVIFSIPYTESAVVCMGLWSARAGQVLQMSPSKQTAPLLGWWENVPFSLHRNVFSCLLS